MSAPHPAPRPPIFHWREGTKLRLDLAAGETVHLARWQDAGLQPTSVPAPAPALLPPATIQLHFPSPAAPRLPAASGAIFRVFARAVGGSGWRFHGGPLGAFVRRGWNILLGLILTFALLPSLAAATQPNTDLEAGRIFLRIFMPYEYGGHPVVSAIAEGSDGVIYLGAGKAVHAFDGSIWKRLDLADGELTALGAVGGEIRATTASSTYRVVVDALGRRSLQTVAGAPRLTPPDTSELKLRSGLVSKVGPGGVRIALPGGNEWQVTSATGLENGDVVFQFEDRLGGLWLGTRFGVVRADLPAPWTLFLRGDGLERSRTVGTLRWEQQLVVAQESGVYALQPAVSGSGRRPARFRPLPFPAYTRSRALITASGDLILAAENGLHVLAPGATAVQTLSPALFVLAAALPDGRAFVAFTERELWWFSRAGGGWTASSAPHGLNFDFTTAAAAADGTIWLASPTRGFTSLRPAATGWPNAVAQALPAPASRSDKYNDFLVFPGPDGPYFASNSALYRHGPNGFVSDPRGRAWSGPVEVPRVLHFDPSGRLWAQLYVPWQPGQTRLFRVNAEGVPDRLVPREAVETLGFGGARVLFGESTAEGEFLWVGVTLGVLRCHWQNGYLEPLPQAPLLRWLSGPESTGEDARTFRAWNRTPLIVEASVPSVFTATDWEYQWRLAAGDEPWSAFSAQREFQLRGLPPGPTQLEARARNALGQVGPIARMALQPEPPWYATVPARAGLGLLALGLLTGFLRWRLRGAERERVRLEAIIADRTADLRLAVERADAASRAKTLFLANMSHELRTPLNAILGYAQLLLRDGAPGERGHDRLTIISNSGEHLLKIINEVLDLAKIEAGKMELHPAPFSLAAMLAAISSDAQLRAAQQGLEFSSVIDHTLPDRQRGDAQKVRQVLENVLGNALKFTARGRITLEVRCLDAANGTVQLSVADTGPGIAPTDRERIFEAFSQAAEGRPVTPGTGLGLALCQRLLGLMDSRLELDSTVGLGSRFSFVLRLPPVAEAVTLAPESKRRVAGYQGPRIRVLIVDDVEANRSLLRDILSPLGFELEEAETGQEAVDRAKAFVPALVLLDLRLPDMDGFAVAAHLRLLPAGPEMKILALSASALTTTREEVIEAGCDDFLGKPFRAEDLFAQMQAALGLEWIWSDPKATPEPVPVVSEGSAGIPTDVLLELLEHARGGAIQPLREAMQRIGSAESDTLTRELAKHLAAYRLTEMCTLIEEELRQRALPQSGSLTRTR